MANDSLSMTETVRVTCALEIKREYELIPAVSCSVCFTLAIAYCFCGYRCFKMAMFLSGLAFGTAVGHLLCLREQLDTQTRAGISLGVGLLGALVTVLVHCVGLFLTGLLLGLLLSVAALLLVGQYYSIFTVAWIPVGAVLGTSIFFALITLCWRKPMTIVATAVMGSAVATGCVDYWVEMPMLVFRVYEGLQRMQGLCWYSWIMIGIWPLLGSLGTLVQCRITANGLSHTDVAVCGKRKQLNLMRIRQTDERRQTDGTYRRRPPPLKRYAGDVLAPSYLASLRERQMNTGSSLSSLSSVHHTVIDFDYETGSLVPLTASASAVLRL
ncbi:transmembrane protein 198-like isoform X2 [Myxocyprinus asiaticus]|uniref:transmembrane protein 198-like isoform X2 n=1 Tax=Myxocyprinus asiaticus TaxID=70543 RepID=UPI002221BF3A|nr:transmembrane protein 198-like isoform X2 [Myxocyprinus asiaticus]